MKRTRPGDHLDETGNGKKQKKGQDAKSLVHPKDLTPSMFPCLTRELTVKAKVLKITIEEDSSTTLRCASPVSGFSRPLHFLVCILGTFPSGQGLGMAASRYNMELRLLGARYIACMPPPGPSRGGRNSANMDEPAFRLIYDSAIELRLTSNRNEEINITRLEQELDSPTRTDRTDNPSDYTLGGCTVVGPKIKSHNEPTTHDALSPLDADILSTSTHQRPSVPIPPASKDGGNGVVIPEMLIQPVSVASDLNFPDYSAGQTDVPTGRSSTACPEPKSLRPSPTPSSSEAPRRVPLAVDPSRIPTNAEQNIQQEPHTMRDSEEGDIFIKKPQLQGSPRSTPKPNSAPGGADRKPKKRKLNKHQRDKKKLAAKLVAERIQREDGSKGVIPLPTTTPLSVTTLSSPQRSPTGGEEQAIMEPDHEPLTILPTSLDATALSSLQRSPKVEEQLAAAEPNQETPTIPLLPGPLKGSRYFDLSEWEDIVSRGDMRLNHFSGIVYLPLLLDENPQRDWHYKIRLMDASEAKLTFDCYVENGFSHWVPPVEVGHAVILRNVKLNPRHSGSGTGYKHNLQWIVYDPKTKKLLPETPPASCPGICGPGELRCTEASRYSPSRIPNSNEMEHLKSLGNWWLRQFAKEDKETVTIQAPPLKHQLISDIKAEDLASSVYNKYIYCDLFFEVLEDFDSSYGFKARDIYITDYTRNPLNKYHPLHEDLALKVSLWKSDREPEKPEIIIEKGKLYRHRNLRVKHSPQGCLEGKINLGSESDKISRIPWVCENERFAAFKERRNAYKGVNSTPNDLTSHEESHPSEPNGSTLSSCFSRSDSPCLDDSFAQTELSPRFVRETKEASFKEALRGGLGAFRVKASVIDLYPQQFLEFVQSYCPECLKVYDKNYTCCSECKKGNCPSPFLKLRYRFLLLLRDSTGDDHIAMVADDHAEHFLGQPPSSDLEILNSSLKYRVGHLLGQLGRYSWDNAAADQQPVDKPGPMMDFGLVPFTGRVNDDGPHFAVVETSLKVIDS